MAQAYTCPNRKHYGRLLDTFRSTQDDARITCPQCGARIDTLSIRGAQDQTECATAPPPSESSGFLFTMKMDDTERATAPPPSPAGRIDDSGNETVAWKQSSPLPQVPGYERIREIGRGGMGVVYQARCLRLNRIVALKMILGGSMVRLMAFLLPRP